MVQLIVQAVFAALQAIPILNKWFSSSDLDKESAAGNAIDKEHDNNAKPHNDIIRPSGDFWKDRGGI